MSVEVCIIRLCGGKCGEFTLSTSTHFKNKFAHTCLNLTVLMHLHTETGLVFLLARSVEGKILPSLFFLFGFTSNTYKIGRLKLKLKFCFMIKRGESFVINLLDAEA